VNARLAISLALLLAAVGCGPRASIPRNASPTPMTVDLTNSSDNELQHHYGERVTMHGEFSLYGKLGAFILVKGRQIYIRSKASHSWGEAYPSMEGRDVRVTGTLRFAHYPSVPEPVTEARPFDHFYFEVETAKIELNQN
jgi:hypothetical protein